MASSVDFRFIPPQLEQPSPSGPSHDPPYYQQPTAPVNNTSVDADQRSNTVATPERSEPSMSSPTNNSREPRKGINPVVIACRLWCVPFICLLFSLNLLSIKLTSTGTSFTLYVLFSRARKIRCDSTRPECNNCLRRNNECEYDAMPKRRGPDKRPGTRQRRCKKRVPDDLHSPNPKRRRTTTESLIDAPESQPHRMADSKHPPQSIRHPGRPLDLPIDSPTLHPSPSLPSSSGSEHLVKVRIPFHYQ